jgi:hypothetical protein
VKGVRGKASVSYILLITNKINNIVRDTRVPLPHHAFFFILSRSRDNHHSS